MILLSAHTLSSSIQQKLIKFLGFLVHQWLMMQDISLHVVNNFDKLKGMHDIINELYCYQLINNVHIIEFIGNTVNTVMVLASQTKQSEFRYRRFPSIMHISSRLVYLGTFYASYYIVEFILIFFSW